MATIHEHYGALEADWLRYYNRKLKEDLWGDNPMNIRELDNYLFNLPSKSSVKIKAGSYWTEIEILLAGIIELLSHQRREFLAVHTKEGTKLPEPITIPKPWDTVKDKKFGTSINEFKNITNGLLDTRSEDGK